MKPALSEQMITRRKSSYLKTPFYKSIWSDQRPPCLFLYEFTYEVNDIKLYLLKEISVCFIVGTHPVIATVNATTSLRRNAGRINGLARYFFFSCLFANTGAPELVIALCHTALERRFQPSFLSPGGGYSQKNWVRLCRPFLETLALFNKSKTGDFRYPIYDLTKN